LLFFAKNVHQQWKQLQLKNLYPNIKASNLSDIFTLYSSDDMDLTLFWEATNTNAGVPSVHRGHHHIPGIHLGIQHALIQYKGVAAAAQQAQAISKKALYAATQVEMQTLMASLVKSRSSREESPARLVLHSKDVYQHDFSKSGYVFGAIRCVRLRRNGVLTQFLVFLFLFLWFRFCAVPVTIAIQNCSSACAIAVSLELLSSSPKPSSEPQRGSFSSKDAPLG
jgi:hypothetical protein